MASTKSESENPIRHCQVDSSEEENNFHNFHTNLFVVSSKKNPQFINNNILQKIPNELDKVKLKLLNEEIQKLCEPKNNVRFIKITNQIKGHFNIKSFNKYLYTTLKEELLSNDISRRYKKYPHDHNQKLVHYFAGSKLNDFISYNNLQFLLGFLGYNKSGLNEELNMKLREAYKDFFDKLNAKYEKDYVDYVKNVLDHMTISLKKKMNIDIIGKKTYI